LRLRPKALTTGYVDGAWWPRSRDLAADGVRVRLSGFWSRPPHTVDVVAGDRRRLTLLLVPPDTSPSAAHHAMMRAARRENTDTVEVLLHDGEADKSIVDVLGAGNACVPEQTQGLG
jgi:hypothetical protein